MSPGDKRRRQAKRDRDRAAYAAALAALPANAMCGTCRHADRVHVAPKLSCDLDSDFNGYAIVAADHRCPSWAQKIGYRPTWEHEQTFTSGQPTRLNGKDRSRWMATTSKK